MNLKKIVMGAALLGLVAMPAMAGLDLTVNIGADDQAHFDFNGGMGRHTRLKFGRLLKNCNRLSMIFGKLVMISMPATRP